MVRWAQKVEDGCCLAATYFPLAFVYSLTGWACWVVVSVGASAHAQESRFLGTWSSLVGVALFAMLNWSYTTAVFTPPGSTTTSSNGYSSLPTHAPPTASSMTVKSNGETRFCKKCQARKPDRAHHCSSCKRCVLKMDHHCPWLATCVGLRNHKAFLLFLIYTTLFSAWCFALSATWTYREMTGNVPTVTSLVPINYIILCITSFVIVLVLGGFTGWHISLAVRGQTTIECLERTQYLTPLRRNVQTAYAVAQRAGQPGDALPRYGQQLIDIHAKALPGITSREEGEDEDGDGDSDKDAGAASSSLSSLSSSSLSREDDTKGRTMQQTAQPPARQPLSRRPSSAGSGGSRSRSPDGAASTRMMSYEEMERYRARRRYEDYLNEQDSGRLPNAFDLGWRRNLNHLLGPNAWLWLVPVCNTTGDGWSWEASPRWLTARERLLRERERQSHRENAAGWGHPAAAHAPAAAAAPVGPSPYDGSAEGGLLSQHNPAPLSTAKADRVLGRDPAMYPDVAAHPPHQHHNHNHQNPRPDRHRHHNHHPHDPPLRSPLLEDETHERASLVSSTDSASRSRSRSRSRDAASAAAERAALNRVTNGAWDRSLATGGIGAEASLLRHDFNSTDRDGAVD